MIQFSPVSAARFPSFLQKPEVAVASTVLYNKYSGVDLSSKDAEFVVVRAGTTRGVAAAPTRAKKLPLSADVPSFSAGPRG